MPKQHENDPRMTNSPEFHQITLMVGGLKSSVESMTDQWRQQEANTTESRRRLHEKFELFREEVRSKMDTLSNRVNRLAEQVTLIEPSVTVFKEEKLRTEGAKRLGGWLMGGITAVAGGIGWGLHELIGYLKH